VWLLGCKNSVLKDEGLNPYMGLLCHSCLIYIISILFPLVHGKTIRENSLLYKNVTATYHRYKGIVPYHFLQCTLHKYPMALLPSFQRNSRDISNEMISALPNVIAELTNFKSSDVFTTLLQGNITTFNFVTTILQVNILNPKFYDLPIKTKFF
jgi:hypothetical protein